MAMMIITKTCPGQTYFRPGQIISIRMFNNYLLTLNLFQPSLR